MKKVETIKEIKRLLNNGKFVRVFNNKNIGYIGIHHMDMWMHTSRGVDYIMWRNYGESAIKNTLKELTWLINDLFHARRKEISYKVYDSCYQAFLEDKARWDADKAMVS